jgi:hypothetical protein
VPYITLIKFSVIKVVGTKMYSSVYTYISGNSLKSEGKERERERERQRVMKVEGEQ